MEPDNSPVTSEQTARVAGKGNRVYQQVIQVTDGHSAVPRYAHLSSSTPSSLPALEHDAQLEDPIQRKLSSVASTCLNWVANAQNPDGGLPTDDLSTPSCTWTTAGLLWAVSSYGVDRDALWSRRAGAWLLDQLAGDGGLPTVRTGDPTTTDATAQALLAAVNYVDPDEETRLPRLAQWLLDSQGKSGGWSWMKWEEDPRVASTSFAILALLAYVQTSPETARIVESIALAMEWIKAAQNSDGGWGEVPQTPSRPSSTGLAILALSQWAGSEDLRIAGGDYLSDTFDDGWPNGLERPSSHTIIRLGTPYAVLGLTSTPEVSHFQKAQAAVPTLLRGFVDDSFVVPDTRIRSWPTRDGLLAIGALLRGAAD